MRRGKNTRTLYTYQMDLHKDSAIQTDAEPESQSETLVIGDEVSIPATIGEWHDYTTKVYDPELQKALDEFKKSNYSLDNDQSNS